MTITRPVLIAAGGTGGHVVPALAVAEALRERRVPVLWAGTERGLESRLVPRAGIKLHLINVRGLRGQNLLDTLMGPLRLARAVVQSVALLRRERVSAVLGMGGFVSGPVALAALMLRIPLVLHEQNAIAGMTNSWLARFASRVFSAFPDVFPAARSAETVGNPVPAGIVADKLRINESHGQASHAQASTDTLHVLVIGGSRGAECLNRVLPDAMSAMAHLQDLKTLRNPVVAVCHQAGAGRGDATRQRYAESLQGHSTISVTVEDFVDDMAVAYKEADLVISRAGAMTVTELAASGTPALLVPYPYAVDDHQTANANWLVSVGAAVLLPEAQLDGQVLAREIEQLLSDPGQLDVMASAARQRFVPGAAARVADALCDLAGARADVMSDTSRDESANDSADQRQHQLGGIR
jgi:UDP-N-acetylglucosamine--N-acetylmuramyl-(pentapeptide) pyrophosphoryl-undecaprenol N-acetylglucosamine transferase